MSELRYKAEATFCSEGQEATATGWGRTRFAAIDHALEQVRRRYAPGREWALVAVGTVDAVYEDMRGLGRLAPVEER